LAVPNIWLVDPFAHTLEAFALRDGHWTVIGLFQEQDRVTVEPFVEMTLELGGLWAETQEEEVPEEEALE
jgi:hypothetical protein